MKQVYWIMPALPRSLYHFFHMGFAQDSRQLVLSDYTEERYLWNKKFRNYCGFNDEINGK